MSEAVEHQAVDLGDVTPARSRHAGRRSAVTMAGEQVVTGTATGDVIAHDRSTLEERWRSETETEITSIVAAAPFRDLVVVGERGPAGSIRCYDAATGALRWEYATVTDVGEAQKESRFFLPFVADVVADGDLVYVAARRYERDGERRSFSSVVYAFDEVGEVVWTYDADASPISIDAPPIDIDASPISIDASPIDIDASPLTHADDRRLAVAYNRCPGDHQDGLVVLDAGTGTVDRRWDPPSDGQRRVGDVSLVEDGVVVASHGDYRGYRLDANGNVRWAVDLATPTTVDGERLYAYPNHVHATEAGVVFVTGNTYATDGRETASLHPREHTAFGYTPDGVECWTADVGGFASELGVDGDRVAVPGAQHFRTRDADVHGLRLFDVRKGPTRSLETEGVVTTVTLADDSWAAVEEPVVYHDEGRERGTYRLLVGSDASG